MNNIDGRFSFPKGFDLPESSSLLIVTADRLPDRIRVATWRGDDDLPDCYNFEHEGFGSMRRVVSKEAFQADIEASINTAIRLKLEYIESLRRNPVTTIEGSFEIGQIL